MVYQSVPLNESSLAFQSYNNLQMRIITKPQIYVYHIKNVVSHRNASKKLTLTFNERLDFSNLLLEVAPTYSKLLHTFRVY